jgi:hypothetical protein
MGGALHGIDGSTAPDTEIARTPWGDPLHETAERPRQMGQTATRDEGGSARDPAIAGR